MGLFSKKIEKQIASYQHELIETHYREVDNMYRQIRGWRHDYRNHIQTMKAYARAAELSQTLIVFVGIDRFWAFAVEHFDPSCYN